MANSPLFCSILCIGFVCNTFTRLLSAEVNIQVEQDGERLDQDSSFLFLQTPEYPRDCSDVSHLCSIRDSIGISLIKPVSYNKPFEVFCDNESDSSGWTVILRRTDGSVNFKRNWNDYKDGFGFLSTEFWLGNYKLSFLTNQRQYELRIDITLDNGTSCYVKHDSFRISDEWSHYTLVKAGKYQSDVECAWEEENIFTDCNDVYSAGHRKDDIYSIRPVGWNGSPFDVFCNMSIDGGNWTVIQRRVNGSTDFYRNWTSYMEGFGNLDHEFWLGNEKLCYLTKQATYEYRIDFVHVSSSYHNKYDRFRIGDETNKYKVIEVGSRTGTRGLSLEYTLDVGFSTYDQDNDGQSGDCAELQRGAWWYGGIFNTFSHGLCDRWFDGTHYGICSYANPNGVYNGGDGNNIFHAYPYTCHIKYTEMKVRRIP